VVVPQREQKAGFFVSVAAVQLVPQPVNTSLKTLQKEALEEQ